MKNTNLTKKLFLSGMLISTSAMATNENPSLKRVVEMEAEVQDYNVGGCNGFSRVEDIQRSALRNALLRVLEKEPTCIVPVLESFSIIEEERFSECSWIEEYRVKLVARFTCY